ncbi:MAG: non-canonical purine NTP pyrophosphatase, partial [Lachnospiraceae bacterium]|nr:non-canonical purine NTP pyrophosphatase [Lachnospiraceae bacterium]
LFFEKVIDANSLKDKTIEDLYRDYDITNRELIEKYNIIIPKEIENVIGFEEGELACFSMNKLCSFIEKLSSINMEQLETSIKKGIDMETEIPIVVIASNNKDKINEIQELLPEYKVISQSESGIDIEVEEDASTFEGNAIKKAETIAKLLDGKLCIADDSGVCVEYLNGEPGVHTKRFLEGTDRDRNIAILEKLRGVSKEKRKATNSTAIAISNGKDTKVIIETLEGYIAEDLRGENGFGFDEIFELEDGRTVAELSKAEQLELKPRGKAVKRITNVLGKKKEIEER